MSTAGLRPARRAGALPTALLLATAAAWLAGCVAVRPAPSPAVAGAAASWPERRAGLQQLSQFSLRGRVALAAGDQGFNASLRWQQSAALSALHLEGPLGMGAVQLQVEGERFDMRTARGEQLDGAVARSALERQLGFDLPIAALRYWLLGVPAPAGGPSEEQLRPDGVALSALSQDGWRVEYPDYVETVGGPRPRRVVASRAQARVRLVVESWAPNRD